MKPTLVLLHGALGNTDQLDPLQKTLSDTWEVHKFGFSGHGGRAALGPCSVQQYADELNTWMQANNLSKPWVLGYSLGGYVALHLESMNPGRFQGVATLATKFLWNPQEAEKEIKKMDPAFLKQKAMPFVETLMRRHAPEPWEKMLEKTSSLMKALGEKPLLDHEAMTSLEIPVLTMIGDRDRMVSIDETFAAYRQLPKGSLAVLPQTGHPIEMMPLETLGSCLNRWLRSEIQNKEKQKKVDGR